MLRGCLRQPRSIAFFLFSPLASLEHLRYDKAISPKVYNIRSKHNGG